VATQKSLKEASGAVNGSRTGVGLAATMYDGFAVLNQDRFRA
jgi:hypothetical protein